jgi:hypothetical protein
MRCQRGCSFVIAEARVRRELPACAYLPMGLLVITGCCTESLGGACTESRERLGSLFEAYLGSEGVGGGLVSCVLLTGGDAGEQREAAG